MAIGTGRGDDLGVLGGAMSMVRLLDRVDAGVSDVTRGRKLALMGLIGHFLERVHTVRIRDVGLRVMDNVGGVDFGVDM